VLLAITGYELALLCTAALFITFALIVAVVIPRTRPDFPGRRLGVFLAICFGLFAVQLTAVFALNYVGEGNERVAETTATETTTTTTTAPPTETTATETTATETTTTSPGGQGQGDAAAGKVVFKGSAGCKGCHTLADAGATGTIGPNLDTVKPTYDKVVTQVTNGGAAMPPFKGTLTEQQIKDVAAYVSSVAGS